ncbi:hypothetical protein CONPUDRAFT_129283 [Coniophora puteana RWD-64-598 SS2]|uniref:Carboxymuconolactone decarboxylase-like domain-containing protein n=1 Tax=Coniophora puteana (strain RWD-64-598) TaxID=741705 RepID=A0A5M3ME80_CONPW|nr:uncharacterized protein CONPUDRAFT_129283 [Coniophora puteana RWD-64-598 SS2]EIW77104.1 hypothetical protein CONPUDRAFT_129283 [Coniophora puteana RWD-64-598 SS2]
MIATTPGESTRIPPIHPAHPPPNLCDSAPFTEALAATLARRSGKGGLLALDQTLLHSPAFTQGWNAMFGAVREGFSVEATLRELAICRVAVLNRARFEWIQHAGLLRQAWIEKIVGESQEAEKMADGRWREMGKKLGMDEMTFAVLAYTDAMTKDVAVPEEIWDQLKKAFADEGDRVDQLLVEMTGIIAGYNCVSRFLVAVDVAGMKEWSSKTQ